MIHNHSQQQQQREDGNGYPEGHSDPTGAGLRGEVKDGVSSSAPTTPGYLNKRGLGDAAFSGTDSGESRITLIRPLAHYNNNN